MSPMSRWVLVIALLSVASAGVGAVRLFRGAVAAAQPAQATPATPVAPDWGPRVDLGMFSVWLPRGWVYEERLSEDTLHGAFLGDGMELDFDYGVFAGGLLRHAGQPGYAVTHETIGGRDATIVVASAPPARVTGVEFAEAKVYRYRCDRRTHKLTIGGWDLTARQQQIALAIFRTVWFPAAGSWTVLDAPSPPGAHVIGLSDIDMVSEDEGWAVGTQLGADGRNEAALLHYTDGRWQPQPSPADVTLMAVDMVSADEGWAVGDHVIAHYDGGTWTVVESNSPGILFDVRMVTPDYGWIVGIGAAMTLRDGIWQLVEDEFSALALDLPSAEDGWATGGGNRDALGPTLYRYEAGAWRRHPWPVPLVDGPLAIEMPTDKFGQGWIGGGGATGGGWLLRRCEPSSEPRYEIETDALPAPVWDIEMLDTDNEGWAVGGDAARSAWLAHFENDAWTIVDTPFTGYLNAVSMVSAESGWAAGMRMDGGRRGVLVRYDGPAEQEPFGPTPTAPPTPTDDPCPNDPPPTPEPLWVDPVTSPTTSLTQTVSVHIGRGRAVTVDSVAGSVTVTGTFTASGSPARVTIPLLPATTHELLVTGTVEYHPGCFYTLTTQSDRNGARLVVQQQGTARVYLPALRNR